MRMVVTPVTVSPFAMAHCRGAAPRYLGSSEACTPRGKEILKRLVKDVDVVLENFRPGTMKKLGLDYPVLKEINPGVIYCAVSGFGQHGPKLAGERVVGGVHSVFETQ